jgi:hypothetical protein
VVVADDTIVKNGFVSQKTGQTDCALRAAEGTEGGFCDRVAAADALGEALQGIMAGIVAQMFYSVKWRAGCA